MKALLFAWLFALLGASPAFAQGGGGVSDARSTSYRFSIESQPVDQALKRLSEQAHTPLLFTAEEIPRVRTNPIEGEFTLSEAVSALLRGTGLSAELVEGAALVVKIDHQRADGTSPTAPDNNNVEGSETVKRTSRAGLLASVAAFLAPTASLSQDTNEQGAEDVIVITGIRGSLQSAVAQKRDAPQIVDAVTAEDIGKFPTENVAEAVQRITGVQITRTRGEGTTASIRGLPTEFTRVQLNGGTLSSATVDLRGGGPAGALTRSFDFRLLPSEFVRTLEVVKSPTADMQDGGLAGTINVVTARPLQLGETNFTASAFAARNSNSGETDPRISGLGSTTFMDGRLGVLLAGGYTKGSPETHSINLISFSSQAEALRGFDYNNDGDLDDSFNIPGQIRTEIAREDRSRTALAGVVEFDATDQVRLFAEGFYSELDLLVESHENLNIMTGHLGPVFDPSLTGFLDIDGIDSNQLAFGLPYAVELGLADTDVRGNHRVNDSVSETAMYKIGAEFTGDLWNANASLSFSDSEMLGDNLNLAQIQRFQVAYSCVPGEDLCGLGFSDETEARRLDPNQGIVASLNGAFDRETRDELTEFRADISREFPGSTINRISFGGVASQRDIFANGQVLIVPATALAPLVGLEASPVQASGFNVAPFTQVTRAGNGAFLDAYGGGQAFPQEWLSTDTLALLGAVARDELLANGFLLQNENTVIDVQEDIAAFYARADFASEDERLTGNFGVRVVRTEQSATGVAPDLNALTSLVDAGGTISVPPAGQVTGSNEYTEILPSANLKIDVTDDVVLRFAASRTMSRPALAQISPSTTVAGGAGNFAITTGNPELDPFIADNFDVTAEWYPNPDAALTLAVFHKDLATLVRTSTDQISLPVTFITESTNTTEVRATNFTRNRPDNEEGVTLRGFEIGYQQFFGALPGLLSNTGVQANYTFIDNSDENVLTAASKNNFNVSGFFETQRLGARVSYTWRDEFTTLGLPDGNNGIGLKQQPRGVLDANFSYHLNDNMSFVFEGVNLTNGVDSTRSTLGDIPFDYFDPGTRLMIGARYRY